MTEVKDDERHPGVLQIHWSFLPTTGGVESHLAELAGALARRRRRVVVLTGEPNPIASDAYQVLTSELLYLPLIKHPSLSHTQYIARLQQNLTEIVSAHRIKIIHAHNMHHFSGAPAYVIDRLRHTLGTRVFHTFHEAWPDILDKNTVYSGCDGNYAVSSHVQEKCDRLFGF